MFLQILLAISHLKKIARTSMKKHVKKESKSILDGAINQQNNRESWLPAINIINSNFEDIEAQIIYGEGSDQCSIKKEAIIKFQEEEWIRNTKDYIIQTKNISNRVTSIQG